MKKLFFIAAITGAALVSCTKNELAPSATEQHEITFVNPVSSVVTKAATLVSNPYPDTETFGVFADYHIDLYADTDDADDFTSYMRGQDQKGVEVKYGSTEITVNGEKYDKYWAPKGTQYYWPLYGYLTFVAYSPYSANNYGTISYSIDKGVKIENYTVSTEVAKQLDLMLSDRTKDEVRANKNANVHEKDDDNTNDFGYDGVPITFNHVLSAIQFKAKTAADYEGYEIKITGLTLNNVYQKATLTQFSGLSTDGDLTWGAYNETTASYEAYKNDTGSEVLTKTAEFVSADAKETNADLILLPQPLKNITLTIEYTVHHADMGDESISYTVSPNLALAQDDKWEPGKKYIYTITIGMEEIVFAPTVTTWDNKTINNPTI